MKKFLQKLFVLLGILVFLSSCATESPVTPVEYGNLLFRVKDLLGVSILLLSHESPFYSDFFSRLYYSYYNITRLIHSNKYGRDGNNHTQVWKKMDSPIKEFGAMFKELRIKYEYTPLSFDDVATMSAQDLNIISDNVDNFNAMLQELETTLPKYDYITEENKSQFFSQIRDIQEEHNKLISIISNNTLHS